MKILELALVAALVALAAHRVWADQSPKYDSRKLERVALQFLRRSPDGNFIVKPLSATLLGLQPVGNTHPAPIPPDTIMICTPFEQHMGVKTIDGRNEGDFKEIGFKCGSDVYVFVTLGLEEAK